MIYKSMPKRSIPQIRSSITHKPVSPQMISYKAFSHPFFPSG